MKCGLLLQPQLGRQLLRARNRSGREIHTHHLRAALRQDQTITPKMALKMQHPLALDRGQLTLFNLKQRALPGAQGRQVIFFGLKVQRGAFFPIGQV